MTVFLDWIVNFAISTANIFIAALFLQNILLVKGIGSSLILYINKKRYNIFIFGVILTIITSVTSIIIYGISINIADRIVKELVMPFICVMVISVVYISGIVIVANMDNIFGKLDSKQIISIMNVSAFSNAVIGVLLYSTQNYSESSEFIGAGLGTGVGFAFANFLIAVNYDSLRDRHIPRAFRGLPIILIYIGIISLAFYGAAWGR